MGSNRELANITVLVAEDEPLVAVGVVNQLTEAGATVVGPCSTSGRAIAALDENDIDVAIIDFVLADDNTEGLQAALEDKGIPYIVSRATRGFSCDATGTSQCYRSRSHAKP